MANEPEILPANIEAEQALLACILQRNSVVDEIGPGLRASHFTDDVHQIIYATALDLIEHGKAATFAVMGSRFPDHKEYVRELSEIAIPTANARQYAALVADLARRRHLIHTAEDLRASASEIAGNDTANDIAGRFSLALDDVSDGLEAPDARNFHEVVNHVVDTAEDRRARGDTLTGITTGFEKLDKVLFGFNPGDLIVIAGRPGMGKTALAWCMSQNVARVADGRCLFFTLEMSAEQLAERALASATDMPIHKVRVGNYDEIQRHELIDAGQQLGTLPIVVHDHAYDLSHVRLVARRLHRQGGLSLVVVDYLQLLNIDGYKTRFEQVSAISRALKRLAKDLGVPVVALSQLSRAVEGRDDKRPQLADLRETGAIEQDADVVMFVYREHYYLARQSPQQKVGESTVDYDARWATWNERCQEVKHLAQLIVGKNRHGAESTIDLRFNPSRVLFTDLEGDR